MMNVVEFRPESAVDLYSTAHFMIMQQGENAIELLNTEVSNLRQLGAHEESEACYHLLRVVRELIDMEFKGPIH